MRAFGGEEWSVDLVIAPPVAKLPTPHFWEIPSPLQMAISAKNKKAQRHVQQGLSLIHARWDFEAYRHFCAAVKEDPECLMAYWGIALSLSQPNGEFSSQRKQAVFRMLDLAEAKKCSEIEVGYAYCLGLLFSGKGESMRKAFGKLSKKYPNDLQLTLLTSYFKKDGFTNLGKFNYGQEQATLEIQKLLKENPENSTVLAFWVALNIGRPDIDGSLRKDVLPYARKLARLAPDYPPYAMMLGHFEWRVGNHALAVEDLRRAKRLYRDYMKGSGVTVFDCEEWIRTTSYLAQAYLSQGNVEKALKTADELAAIPFPKKRLKSPGSIATFWEAHTLHIRMRAAVGTKEALEQALKRFPSKKQMKPIVKVRSTALFYYEGLRQYVKGLQELMKGDSKIAGEYRKALEHTGGQMFGANASALVSPDVAEWKRAVNVLEIYNAELRGLVALRGPKSGREAAKNWFLTSSDMLPRWSGALAAPIVPRHPELNLADYEMAHNEPRKAAKHYQRILDFWPNDFTALFGYERALRKLEMISAADKIAEQIKLITAWQKEG